MFGLFVYVDFRFWSHWICSLLFPSCWAASMSSRGYSTAVGFLALGYFHSFLADLWLLEVSAVLRNIIRINLLSTSTRSLCEYSRVGIIEIPLFRFTLIIYTLFTNHHIWVLNIRILPSVKNRNTYRINSFVVICWPFYHSLWQRGNRIRIWMINSCLMTWLLDPSIQFNFSISTLSLLLAILIVFHMHILLYFPQVLLRLWYHWFQLRWRHSWSILHIWKF